MLEEFIKTDNQAIIVHDNRPASVNTPIHGSILIRKMNGLYIYLYPKKFFGIMERKDAKVILVVGLIGSGKTRFINCLINYHMGINLSDTFRYFMVDEINSKEQGISNTENINEYHIDSNGDKPRIIIIDTPGIVDSKGNDNDRII